mmetsp:Transcript_26225/g.67445  ORF Transcript_26225/g.67445 Transcript_26225/m.67445 type:complete len:203 (+) Transcript_26225:105-713(+)
MPYQYVDMHHVLAGAFRFRCRSPSTVPVGVLFPCLVCSLFFSSRTWMTSERKDSHAPQTALVGMCGGPLIPSSASVTSTVFWARVPPIKPATCRLPVSSVYVAREYRPGFGFIGTPWAEKKDGIPSSAGASGRDTAEAAVAAAARLSLSMTAVDRAAPSAAAFWRASMELASSNTRASSGFSIPVPRAHASASCRFRSISCA